MTLEKIEIPVPRLGPRSGGAALSTAVVVLAALSAAVISEHVYLLDWMETHDSYDDGFELDRARATEPAFKLAWLPALLYKTPHHQLAIAASIVNIVAAAVVMILFAFSVRTRKNFGQHWHLALLSLILLALNTTALLYNFIEHGVTDRLDTRWLYETASPFGYPAYGAAWLDFESWSCGLARHVRTLDADALWDDNCHRARLGRWLLLPTWFALVGVVLVAWFAFRGVPGWRGDEGEEEAVEGGEGRVRLP